MSDEEKRVLRGQIMRVIAATPACPDGHGRPCDSCIATALVDALEIRFDAERLAK